MVKSIKNKNKRIYIGGIQINANLYGVRDE